MLITLWCFAVDRARIAFIIKEYSFSKTPGYLDILELYCRKMFGRGCIDLFLDEPEKLKEALLVKYSGDAYSTYFTIKIFFLRPVLTALNMLELEEELAQNFLKNPSLFKEKLHRVLAMHS
jgi:hypothetical protein